MHRLASKLDKPKRQVAIINLNGGKKNEKTSHASHRGDSHHRLLTGCSSNKTKKVVVSEVTHSVFYAPQYVAINLGFFEKRGIELELYNGGGADKVMTAVLANQVDIGFAGPEAAIYVYLQGKEDKYLPAFTQN